jgi:hypothetical protein
MATYNKPFDSYKIWYYSDFTYDALIYCYNGSSYAGRLAFIADDKPLPENKMWSNQPSLYYHTSKFEDIIDILRNEGPLYLYFNDNNNVGILATSQKEPVGEEE